MITRASRKAALRAPLWPMVRRVERHARLFGEMIERLEVNPGAVAREEGGRAFAAASRRCLWCPHATECRDWLDRGGSAAAPLFCPNAPFLTRVRGAGDGI